MITATYDGPGWVLAIERTGTHLLRGQATTITEEEAAIVDGHPDVALKRAAPKRAARGTS